MAQVNIGAIKFNWKGPYNNSTAYIVDDVVSSGGSSYVCILASQGNAVSNGTYWQIMSSAGTNGTDGTDGTNLATTLTTQGDIVYRDGSGLARLGYGTNGQLLKTGGSGANPSWTDAPSGVMKKIHHFTKSTRTTHNNNANTAAFTWTSSFTPLDPTNNTMYVSGIVPVDGAGQNFCGYGLRFTPSSGSNVDFQGYGSMYATYSTFQGIQSYIYIIPAGTLAASTYTIFHFHYTADSNAEVYFPSGSDESRLNQTRGDLTIMEYKN
jgi:hypothetical protein